ncbi:MAG: molybdopterin-dependent oxidoreductase [Gemmatimonadota bacterium]|jgi:DMSO/TMAO reductase YedYZ molybdopterin-dependent catalytic subunit
MMDRRKFLALGGMSFSAFLAGCDSRGPRAARPLLDFAQRQNEKIERILTRHTAIDVAEDYPLAGRALPAYYVSRSVPVWDEAQRGRWRLEVTGLVDRPLRLSLDELQRLPSVTQRVNHYCVEGWMAVTEWTGVRLRELADAAGVRSDAAFVDFESFDSGYHESWDLESALHPQTLVAYGWEGNLLGAMHGAPARLHSPAKLGYKNVKYLTRVVFMPAANGGYWSDQGYEWYGGT